MLLGYERQRPPFPTTSVFVWGSLRARDWLYVSAAQGDEVLTSQVSGKKEKL